MTMDSVLLRQKIEWQPIFLPFELKNAVTDPAGKRYQWKAGKIENIAFQTLFSSRAHPVENTVFGFTPVAED